MFKKRVLISLLSLLCLISFASNAFACACCAEPGTYWIHTSKVDAYDLELLGDLKFEKDAALYMTEAGFDGLKGLAPLEKELTGGGSWVASPEGFDLVGAFTAKTWKFNFKSKGGKPGVLTLPIPTQMLDYKADIHDTPEGESMDLHKELRFKGTVQSGTGFFQSGIVKPTGYFLVFQGRGNMCNNASDYTHWRLEITGRKASYAFFGELVPVDDP